MIADYLNLKAESLDSITISRNGVEIVLDVTKEREEQEAKKMKALRMKLKIKRIQAGMSGRELAEAIGLDKNNYSRLERGEMLGTLDRWLKIQKVLGIPSSDMWEIISEGREA